MSSTQRPSKAPHRTLLAVMALVGLYFLTGCSLEVPDVGRPGGGEVEENQQQRSQQTTSTTPEGTTGAAYRGPETYSVTVTETVDGDTVVIEPAIEGRNDLRLVGVDTPELDSDEPLAQEAAQFTEEELAGEQVTLIMAEENPVDPYGRLLGTIKPAGQQQTHGQRLLREGYGQTLFYEPNTQYQMLYLSTQENAAERGAGIWGLPLAERCELANNGNSIGAGSPECE